MARAHALRPSEVNDAHVGFAITHDVLAQDGSLLVSKGALLDADAIGRLADVDRNELHLLELESDDLHEDVGGLRVARAVAGTGLRITDSAQSRFDLVADQKGLLRVDRELLRAINDVPDVTVYTMLDRQPVTSGTVVASVKITPIAVAERRIVDVERLCHEATAPTLQVRPFLPLRVGVLALNDVSPETRARFEAAIERKLRWYGASLIGLIYAEPRPDLVANALLRLLDDGAQIILAAGGNTIDPLDPIGQALEPIGGRLVHRGAPTRGSMFWLAEVGQVPIINVASCRMWTGGAVGDLILPLVMAGERVTSDDIIDIGYGGLPGSAVNLRYPKYESESQ